MKGFKYAFYATEGGRQMYRHALWVPQASILFQWTPPGDSKQVVSCTEFPYPGAVDSTQIDELEVEKEVIEEARRYLDQRAHLDAQERSVSIALERIRGLRMVNETRAQKSFRSMSLHSA